MASIPESRIEATVEVISEIPEDVKEELKRKRKRLKEKSKLSTEEKHFDLDAIEPDAGDDILLKEKKLPPIHREPKQLSTSKSEDSCFSSEDNLSRYGQSYNQYTNEDKRPIPPPRKTKKSQETQELISFKNKPVDLSSTVNETICEDTLVEVSNKVLKSEVKKKPRKSKKNADAHIQEKEFAKGNVSAASCDEISEEDAVDFFTKVWDESPQPETQEEASEDISQDEADSIHLIQKELQDKLTGADIVKFEKASYIPFHVKMENEKNVLFYPSSKQVPMDMKLPEGKEPRRLADEGFFVGKKPFISKSNVNRMENRFVTQKEFQWFGEDGCLKISPDPVCDNPVRHLYEGYGETTAEVEHIKAMIKSDKWRIKGDKDRRYQLDLDISSISFLHHPLFSSEHVTESRLIQMYQKYKYNEKKEISNTLKQRLKALRTAASNLKQSMQIGMEESSINNERLSRLKQYQNDIRQTKKMRDLKEEEQKNLWTSILSTWEELKACRQSQGFISTSLNLKIHREKTNEKIEKEEFERELQDELEEEMEDYESCSEKLFEQYEEDMKKWKEWNKAVKLAKKRQKMRKKFKEEKEKDGEDNEKDKEEQKKIMDELAETKIEDEKLLSEPEISKPKPVAKFNSTLTLEKLRNNALKMRRKPGDPILHISVDNDITITPSSQCPRDEMQRRNAVSKTKIYFKIMFNDKKVAETCKRSLTQDFKAVWGQIFKLQILHYPQTFNIEIFESGFFERHHIAELYIPIPTASQSAFNSKLIDHQFSSDHVIPPKKHNGVGCGVPYKLPNGAETYLLMNGILKCSLVWGVSETGAVLVPEDIESPSKRCKKVVPLSHLKSSKFSDIGKMKQWIKKSNLDPLNPENIGLYKLFQEMGLNSNNSAEDCCSKESSTDPFDFCSMEEIENNKRFQLLQLRNQDISQFRNLTMIPCDENDLDEEMLLWLNQKTDSINFNNIEDGEHAQREKAKLLMQKVREEVAKRFYVSQHQKIFEDVVLEEKVPSIGTIGFSLLKLLQPRRPLYPSRKERKKVTCANTNMDVKIIIKIQHASNVPVRMDVDPIKHTKDTDYTTIQIDSQVQPFVEVMFQRMAVKTGIADGPHPTWNQELELPFCAPNDNYGPSSLETVKDVIYINLFDEVTVNLLEDDTEKETVVYERLERRWLGNLKIPFTTLYLNSKIEGAFRLNVPPVLLSYHNEPRPWLSGLSDVSENHTYISFFMTIEPCLQLPEVFRDQGDSSESDKILYEVEKWQQAVIPRYPDRLIKLMSIDLSGEWIFISRFLHPLAPPEELSTTNKDSLETLEILARFVSLIPTVADSITFPGLCDIWSTSDQFLQMLTGDEEEHAILLCNYFLHLGKKAMLLLGSGIPEGPTAYVVTWEKEKDVWVWNASTGDHFSVRDNRNPLQSVGCLISSENVWANIQRNSHPSRINFDLSKSSEWKPFFYRGFPNPGLKTVQPSSLTYMPTDPEYVKKLQENLENDLQDSIIKWRQKISTVWNNDCSKVLYKILTRLERNAGRTASDDSLQELEQILKTHKMNGFPLSLPYTDNEAVIETVFATGVHLNEDKNAEYSIAVYVHPYPCSILAVWVYVAVLTPRKNRNEIIIAEDSKS